MDACYEAQEDGHRFSKDYDSESHARQVPPLPQEIVQRVFALPEKYEAHLRSGNGSVFSTVTSR
jgi:hypothetical protein